MDELAASPAPGRDKSKHERAPAAELLPALHAGSFALCTPVKSHFRDWKLTVIWEWEGKDGNPSDPPKELPQKAPSWRRHPQGCRHHLRTFQDGHGDNPSRHPPRSWRWLTASLMIPPGMSLKMALALNSGCRSKPQNKIHPLRNLGLIPARFPSSRCKRCFSIKMQSLASCPGKDN